MPPFTETLLFMDLLFMDLLFMDFMTFCIVLGVCGPPGFVLNSLSARKPFGCLSLGLYCEVLRVLLCFL